MDTPTGLTVRFIGLYRNETTRYYWVQAIYPSGNSALAGPIAITGPSSLDLGNVDIISWNPIGQALAYNVLVTSTASTPTGTSNILVRLSSGAGAENRGQVLGSWTEGGGSGAIPQTTDNLPEGDVNFYYTDERAEAIALLSVQTRDIQWANSFTKQVDASGTVYTLTATPALVDFGTTDPTITPAVGSAVYLVLFKARIDFVGATFAASKNVTVKVRQTHGTAADVTDLAVYPTGIVTTLSATLGTVQGWGIYFNAVDDVLSLFASVESLPSAGTVVIGEASVIILRIG